VSYRWGSGSGCFGPSAYKVSRFGGVPDDSFPFRYAYPLLHGGEEVDGPFLVATWAL